MKVVDGDFDPGASKFFGAPTIPLAWENDFYDDEIFFCQIRLEDIAQLDTEDRLPHNGYLYVFLHTGESGYEMKADVRYYDGEPELLIDDFNATVEGYEHFNDSYMIEFYATDEDIDGTRLFGEPSDWNYADKPPRLLMQYDPLDNDTGFLDYIDGYLYLFFGEDHSDISAVYLHEEFS